MREALQVIEITNACPADRLFISQIRLQLLKQRADDIRQQDEAGMGTETDAASAPRLLYLKTLRRQLHELRASFAPDLQQIGKSFHASYTWFDKVAKPFRMQTSSTPMLNTSSCISIKWGTP
jgi:hypothetical protein